MEILAAEKTQFQKEQDKLLQTIIDSRFFNPWKQLSKYGYDLQSLQPDASLELYLTSNCNQNCEYCYLQKHNNLLYPSEFNKPEIIIKNLNKIYQWIITNNFSIPCLDLFSGDIWDTPLGWDILETTYKYLKQGMKIQRVLIASNCSFVNDPKALQIIQQYIDKFNQIGCPLVYSISIDGKIIDNYSRPHKNKNITYTDEYYDNIGAFAIHNGFLFHPMISPHNVHLWKENYEWWKQYLDYYGMPITSIMTLEVRDPEWTDESIKDYNELMNIFMDEFLYINCKGNKTIFAKAIAGTKQKDPNTILYGYVPWFLNQVDSFYGCSISNHLSIRVGDFAIVPCHRTAYKEYLYGYLIEEDNILTSKVHAINPVNAIKIYMGNLTNSLPYCDACDFNYCCLRGCLGSQLETTKDPFFPIESVCHFFKEKYKNTLRYLQKQGILDELRQLGPLIPNSENVANMLQLYDKIKEEL